MITTNNIKLNPNNLLAFCGTENHYFLPLFQDFIYTDGIKYLATEYEMYWLITDIAALLPKIIKTHHDYFYCITLKQLQPGQIELIFTDGNNNNPIFSQKYDFTNLQFTGCDKKGNPIQEIKLFLQQGQNEQGQKYYCLMLPNEY